MQRLRRIWRSARDSLGYLGTAVSFLSYGPCGAPAYETLPDGPGRNWFQTRGRNSKYVARRQMFLSARTHPKTHTTRVTHCKRGTHFSLRHQQRVVVMIRGGKRVHGVFVWCILAQDPPRINGPLIPHRPVATVNFALEASVRLMTMNISTRGIAVTERHLKTPPRDC